MIGFSFINDSINAADIAIVHTCFNVAATAVLLPFSKVLEKLACLTYKDEEHEDEEFQMLDERLLATPGVAVYRSKTIAEKMALLAKNTLFDAIECLSSDNPQLLSKVIENESKIDLYEDKLGTYLVKLSKKDLNPDDSKETSKILNCIGDFERIGDHAVNIKETADEIREKGIVFSGDAQKELSIMTEAVKEILTMATDVFVNGDVVLATRVEPLEQVINILKASLKSKHIERLKRGECTTEMGFIFSDLITNYERVADHCSNIAICIIEVENNSFSSHEYVHELVKSHNQYFEKQFEAYKTKYALR